jgi:hypothetical protein
MVSLIDELGPLPEGDRQDTLQQLSLKALRNCLPEDKFLFHDERGDDKGVDGALEAKVEVRVTKTGGGEEVKPLFTNCRAQAQLKSTDKPKQNQDGSVSYPIETSNLNYLLNGPSPIYFLWIAPTNEVRYAWARDEWQRLDVETPDWKDQGTFTVRFRHILTQQAVDEIHERILKEARLARRINEVLARSAMSERVVVSIDPQTLQTTDPRQVYEWLNLSGMTIVSAGYGQQARAWVEVLNPNQQREARIQLVAAYAQASLGRNHEALGHLSAAALRRAEFSPADQQFLDYLRDACEYQTGRVDLQTYLRREEEWSQRQKGAAAVEHRLEVLRQERLRERDQGRRAALLAEMRGCGAEIQSANDTTPAQKLQTRIVLMSAEGDDLAARFIEDVVLLQSRLAMGFSVGGLARQTAEATARRWEEWDKGARAILEDAAAEGHPFLIADALTARLVVYLEQLLFRRMEAAANGRGWEAPEATIHALMRDAEDAMDIYSRAGNLEGQTRAKLLLADLFEAAGQEQAAKNLAEGAIVVARAMSYARHESHAQEYLDGQTMFRRFQVALAQREAEDEDIDRADSSDEDLRRFARHSLAVLSLPAERLPVLDPKQAFPPGSRGIATLASVYTA